MKHTSPAASSDSHQAHWKLKIDKLTLLHELPDQWKDGYLTSCLSTVKDPSCQSQYGIGQSYTSGGGYKLSIEGKVPLSHSPLIWSSKAAYLLQIGPKKAKHPDLRLDINPGALTPAGLQHLREVLDTPFGVPWACWAFARVSRIDVAVDLPGVALTDWVWDLPKRKNREIFCRDAAVRTLYLGSKKSTPLVVYNKAKQDPSAAADGGALTRVEYRFKNVGTVSALVSLKNPLADVEVFDPRKLPVPPPHRTALMALGHLGGWQAIIKSFPPEARLTFDKLFASICADWWDPTAIWGEWTHTLKQVVPSADTPSGALDGAAMAYVQAMDVQAATLAVGTSSAAQADPGKGPAVAT